MPTVGLTGDVGAGKSTLCKEWAAMGAHIIDADKMCIRDSAYLIEERHVRPWRILALTFTNKAAREMKSRAEAILDGNLQGLEISTFHAYGLRFLPVSYTHLTPRRH